MLQQIKKFIVNPKARFAFLNGLGFYGLYSDEAFIRKAFRTQFGYDLDLDHPKTFNEKIQWMKLHDRDPLHTALADKYKVRGIIKDTIGEEYLIPLLGVWENPDDIDFDALPSQFVLKCNHNSGKGMFICKDKNQADFTAVRRNLKKGLKENYYRKSREWQYKDIQPKVICEEMLVEESGDLKDYKVLCFDGKPKLIEVHQHRFREDQSQDFYDLDWNKTTISQSGSLAGLSHDMVERPVCFDDMIRLSQILADGLPLCRVDWYEVNGRLYFGEVTFFDGSGLEPFDDFEYDKLLGSWITLKTDI